VRDRDLGRELALKESLDQSDEAMARFTREALTTSRLEHPSQGRHALSRLPSVACSRPGSSKRDWA